MRPFLFPTMVVLVAFTAYVYPFKALLKLLFDAQIFSLVSLILTAAVAAALFVYMRTHNTSPYLRAFLYYGLGVGFIGIWVLTPGLFLSLIFPDVLVGVLCLAVVGYLTARAVRNADDLHVKKLKIISPKVKKAASFVFVSDAHIGSNPPSHLEKICKEVKALDHDFLLIGGDLFDSSSFESSDLDPLGGIKKPILFVTGNHEHYVEDNEKKISGLSKHGVKLIDDKKEKIGEMNIVGIGDNHTVATQAEIAGGLIKEKEFNLVMVHRPGLWDRMPEHTDLMLSGHTHNGQIYPFHVIVSMQFKAVFGLYRRGTSLLYVSSGGGCWGPRMRLGTRNEIVHITVSPK